MNGFTPADSIYSMLGRLIQPDSKGLLDLLPKEHRFRYSSPSEWNTEQKHYQESLFHFLTLVLEKGIDELESPKRTDMIVELESKLLRAFALLQWQYHMFFDTSLFYWYFSANHREWVHPELMNILYFYASHR
jgi:hypothetical protein